MLTEHILYSGALAILAGMVFCRYTGRDPSWIIIVCSWAPDGVGVGHAYLHNIAFMAVFSILFALVLRFFGLRFFDALLFSLIGYGAHLVEDALVYETGYRFLWPFSNKGMGLGLFHSTDEIGSYVTDFFRIANTQVLVAGLLFLLLAILIRTYVEGPAWIRWYVPENLYRKFSRK